MSYRWAFIPFVLSACLGHGQWGTLDQTFGNFGYVTTNVAGSFDYAQEVAIQPNGRIVVVGRHNAFPDRSMIMARYMPDGTLDVNFSDDGLFELSSTYGEGEAWQVALQANGRILVAGKEGTGIGFEMALIRLTVSGELDNTFGMDGRAAISLPADQSVAWAMAVLPDGAILIGGWELEDFSPSYRTVVKISPQGFMDPWFGEGGYLRFGSAQSSVEALAALPDGRFLVAGVNGPNATIMRCMPDGTLDPSFGVGGLCTHDPPGTCFVRAMALKPDGKILIGGYVNSFEPDLFLFQVDSNGVADPTFGTAGGVLTEDPDTEERVDDIIVEPTGHVTIAGRHKEDDEVYFLLKRFDAQGQLDPNFGTAGSAINQFSGNNCYAYGIARQVDGKLVAVGTSLIPNTRFAVARYNVDIGVGQPEMQSVQEPGLRCTWTGDAVCVESTAALPHDAVLLLQSSTGSLVHKEAWATTGHNKSFLLPGDQAPGLYTLRLHSDKHSELCSFALVR